LLLFEGGLRDKDLLLDLLRFDSKDLLLDLFREELVASELIDELSTD
jgi:hypothetical protein